MVRYSLIAIFGKKNQLETVIFLLIRWSRLGTAKRLHVPITVHVNVSVLSNTKNICKNIINFVNFKIIFLKYYKFCCSIINAVEFTIEVCVHDNNLFPTTQITLHRDIYKLL